MCSEALLKQVRSYQVSTSNFDIYCTLIFLFCIDYFWCVTDLFFFVPSFRKLVIAIRYLYYFDMILN